MTADSPKKSRESRPDRMDVLTQTENRRTMLADELLEGAIDLHVHGYPEIAFDVQTRLDDVEIARSCVGAGMRGFVLKSHLWPTVGRAYHIKKLFPGLNVFPGITLNHTVGGLNAISVESAARQGAKVLFMPTWSAANDLRNGGFGDYMRGYFRSAHSLDVENGITLLNDAQKLRAEMKEILRIAKDHDMVVATGHVSPGESLALLDEAASIGLEPVVFSHPYTRSVGGTMDHMEAMAQKGAYVEICALAMMPAFQTIHPSQVIEIVRTIGAERCILSSDFFFEWAPSPPEMLRIIIGTLLTLGLTDQEARCLVQGNPRAILAQ